MFYKVTLVLAFVTWWLPVRRQSVAHQELLAAQSDVFSSQCFLLVSAGFEGPGLMKKQLFAFATTDLMNPEARLNHPTRPSSASSFPHSAATWHQVFYCQCKVPHISYSYIIYASSVIPQILHRELQRFALKTRF